MLRRNPTRLEIRQDDGKRKSIELEDTIQRQSQQQQQSLQQPQEQPIPIVGTEELRNLKNNMTTQERIGL
ncbi:unnamed protein product [Rhizophagus irregularis]|nr:unnamed protein product [Rhizophagus irregularis]